MEGIISDLLLIDSGSEGLSCHLKSESVFFSGSNLIKDYFIQEFLFTQNSCHIGDSHKKNKNI